MCEMVLLFNLPKKMNFSTNFNPIVNKIAASLWGCCMDNEKMLTSEWECKCTGVNLTQWHKQIKKKPFIKWMLRWSFECDMCKLLTQYTYIYKNGMFIGYVMCMYVVMELYR